MGVGTMSLLLNLSEGWGNIWTTIALGIIFMVFCKYYGRAMAAKRRAKEAELIKSYEHKQPLEVTVYFDRQRWWRHHDLEAICLKAIAWLKATRGYLLRIRHIRKRLGSP